MEKGKRNIKQAYRVSYLLAGYVKQTLTNNEQEELNEWIAESDHNRALFAELTDTKNVQKDIEDYQGSDPEDYLEKSKQQLQFKELSKPLNLKMYLIAASILLAVVLILYFKPFSRKEVIHELVKTDSADLLPGSGQAVLSYTDGRKIILKNKTTDTTIDEGLSIHSKDGELIYQNSAFADADYHTLTVPRKGFYKLKLPDGTVAWLNSESSIRYPTSFPGSNRTVFITGEVYFDVIHNEKKPFRVVTGDVVIEDVGTSFNVDAYADEGNISATLVEGSIKVISSKQVKIIQPGEQIKITPVGNGSIVKEVNIEEITGWKNGQFKFVNTPLPVIMRQVARWYDAEIIYQDSVNVHLNATIERNVPVSKLLYLLSKTDDVHFKIEGNKIIVMK